MQFGSIAFHVVEGGLDAKYWGLSLLIGTGSFPVQQIINVFYGQAQNFNLKRNDKRRKRAAHLTVEVAE